MSQSSPGRTLIGDLPGRPEDPRSKAKTSCAAEKTIACPKPRHTGDGLNECGDRCHADARRGGGSRRSAPCGCPVAVRQP